MLSARTALLATAFVLPMGTGGCNKNKSEPVAPEEPAAGAEEDAPGITADLPPVDVGPKINVQASVEGIDDMLAALQDLSKKLDPEDTSDPMADLQAGLLQMGFGPGFMGNLDLARLHALSVALPMSEAASPKDAELAATLAVVDARKMIEATPPSFRPQPLGEGMWEMQQGGVTLKLAEADKELLIGMDDEDLSEAKKLREKIGEGRRIRARAWNIPTDQVDVASLFELPPELPFVKSLNAVVQGLEAMSFEADFGTKRDLEVLMMAEAPVYELGLEPFGEARTTPTELEGRLPGNPVFITTMAWGNPDMIKSVMEKGIPMGQVPAPFVDIVQTGVSGMKEVLDQVASDVVFGIYLDKTGDGTFLMAAEVKDEAKTLEAFRKLDDAIIKTVEAQATMAGDNKEGAFGVDFKKEGVRLGRTKADSLTLEIPKQFESDFEDLAIFVDGNEVQAISLVKDGTAVVAIGAGSKRLAGDIAKTLGRARKESLAQSPGLAAARQTIGGCQICMSFDPVEYLELRLRLLLAQKQTDKKVAKAVKQHLAKIAKIGSIGEAGAGVKLEKEEAAVAFNVPESVFATPGDKLRTIDEVFEFVDGPETAMAASEDPATPPTKKSSTKK